MGHSTGKLANSFQLLGLAELFFKLLAIGNVHMGAHHAQRLPLVTVKQEGPGQDINVGPLLVPHPELDLKRGDAFVQDFTQMGQGGLDVVGVEQPLPAVVTARQFFIGVAQHGFPARRAKQRASL